MGSRRHHLFPALLVCALAVGCGRTTYKASLADDYASRDETVEMDFWDAISTKRAITNNDALHALVLSFTKSSASAYKARVSVAKKRGWIRDAAAPANETARIGWIARAVCLECGIKGGLTMRVVGPRERYAVRELNHRKWIPGMSRNQAISGLQLIALLGSAEDFVEKSSRAPKEDW